MIPTISSPIHPYVVFLFVAIHLVAALAHQRLPHSYCLLHFLLGFLLVEFQPNNEIWKKVQQFLFLSNPNKYTLNKKTCLFYTNFT